MPPSFKALAEEGPTEPQTNGQALVLLNRSSEINSAIKKMEEARQNVEELKDYLPRLLGLEDEEGSGFFGALTRFWPGVHDFLPKSLAKFVAEEDDPIQKGEYIMREGINTTQESIKTVAQTAKQERKELGELEADLEIAVKENWDAQKLQRYLAEKSGIKVFPEVLELLNIEHKILPAEVVEARKKDILGRLQRRLKVGEKFMEALGGTLAIGLDNWNFIVQQYYEYTHWASVLKPISDASKAYLSMGGAVFFSRDVLVETLDKSVKALNASVQAVKLGQEHAIASPEMMLLLEDKLSVLRQELVSLGFPAQDEPKSLGDGGEVVEAEVVEVGAVKENTAKPSFELA